MYPFLQPNCSNRNYLRGSSALLWKLPATRWSKEFRFRCLTWCIFYEAPWILSSLLHFPLIWSSFHRDCPETQTFFWGHTAPCRIYCPCIYFLGAINHVYCFLFLLSVNCEGIIFLSHQHQTLTSTTSKILLMYRVNSSWKSVMNSALKIGRKIFT